MVGAKKILNLLLLWGSFHLECDAIGMLYCPIWLVFKDVKAYFKGIETQQMARFGKVLGIFHTALG